MSGRWKCLYYETKLTKLNWTHVNLVPRLEGEANIKKTLGTSLK